MPAPAPVPSVQSRAFAAMRFLGISETCDLGALYLRLIEEGHEVRVSIEEPLALGTMAGMVPRAADWRAELDWVRAAGADGVILFEAVSEEFGAIQDALRRDGFQVIGGSAYGDRLENDRAYAQGLLAELGFPTGHVREFTEAASAEAFLTANPGRYVLKFSGPDNGGNYVGQLPDGRDVRAVLAARLRERDGAPATFILMDHIEGVEMGVGAYFDGTRFLTPACLDWEHKRFFAGDMGELTGEMGTVATFERSASFFERTLKRIEPQLRAAGHVGYVNMNTIVNEAGIWPLEFTSRFGYPGFAILEPLQETKWGELFAAMAGRPNGGFSARPGFSVGIVLTTPPFPYSRHQIEEPVGLPVLLDGIDGEDRRNLHYGEVGLEGDQLVTSGVYGWTMVVTGTGPTIAAAQRAAYERVTRVTVPNMRYRLDIGERVIRDWARLKALELLDS
jgi:phosphoribosylamine--glycine ligase